MKVDPTVANEFLSQSSLAVIGASDDPRNFGHAVNEELRSRGYDVVPVNPTAATVLGDECYPTVAAVPGRLDGAIVMVHRATAVGVVKDCISAGVPRVWLFKGFGTGACSDEAVALCEENGVAVVAGACPFMFLEPVGGIHRFHRAVRRLNGSLAAA